MFTPVHWNYTKTVAILLACGFVVRVADKLLDGSTYIGGPGGPLGTVVAAALVCLPFAVLADLVSWGRNRRAERRARAFGAPRLPSLPSA
jgi:hypothetical protein